MQSALRAVGAIIMAIILIISIIYLAFSIDIIHSSQQYGEFFRPKQGLSIFNIIISIFGIFLAIFNLFILSAARITFCRIGVVGCLIFALFAFASLIAALAINLVAIDRTSGLFTNYMNQYTSNADARNIINTVQIQYECCGNNVWYDWIEMPKRTTTTTSLDTTSTSTLTTSLDTSSTTTSFDTSSTTTIVIPKTTSTSTESSSTMSSESTETILTESTRTRRPPRTTGTTTIDSNIDSEVDVDTTSDSSLNVESIVNSESGINSNIVKHEDTDTDEVQTNDEDLDQYQSTSTTTVDSSRHGRVQNKGGKRAAHQKRSIFSHEDPLAEIDVPFTVVLPGSCCLNRSTKPDQSANSYCVPNQSPENGFYRDGCSKMIAKYAISQTFTMAVINSLLIVFALLSVPLLSRLYPLPTYRPKIYRNPSLQSQHITDGYTGPSTVGGKPRDSVVNPNPDYSVYQKNG